MNTMQPAAYPLQMAVPQPLISKFIRVKYDLAKCVQILPEMNHDDLIKANINAGGYAWLDDPSEDIYND